MSWKFWKKDTDGEGTTHIREAKLSKPKELPDRVGMYLVTQLKEDPDWVWSLKVVSRPRPDEKHTIEVRIFDPKEAAKKGVTIMNYNSLDEHSDMVLFFGWYNKNTGLVKIDRTLKDVA
jgi:hypothetical protein